MTLPEKLSDKLLILLIIGAILFSLALMIEELFDQPIILGDFLMPIGVILIAVSGYLVGMRNLTIKSEKKTVQKIFAIGCPLLAIALGILWWFWQ